jgi:glycosyltransferase involved in cell wall biosynthesis
VQIDVLVWSRYLQPGEVVISPTENGKIYRVGLYRHWDMTMIQTLNVLDWLDSQNTYEAIWGHYLFPAGFLAVWFAKLKGLPSVVSARGNDIDREIFPPGDFSRLQWSLSNAALITAVSHDLACKIKLLAGREDVIVLHNAVDTDIFNPRLSLSEKLSLRQSLGISENEIVLGFSRELREKKGQAFLFKALTKVRHYHPCCLLIIGQIRNPQDSWL